MGVRACDWARLPLPSDPNPPEVQSFPPDSGTYRTAILPSDTSVGFSIVSNCFTVAGDSVPTS